MTTIAASVDVDDLVSLFTGDEWSPACHSATLVDELCRRIQPHTVTDVRMRIYGDWPPELIPQTGLLAIAHGWTRWLRAGRPC